MQPSAMIKSGQRRRGAAVTELAVCLPTISLLLLGSIECCNMIFVQQAMAVASYEGARASTRRNSTNTMVTQSVNGVLTARRVKSATITISSPDIRLEPPGTPVTVTVSTACASNSYLPPWFFAGRNLVARCSMVRE